MVEVEGWATRGKPMNPPKVVIAHHTATRPSTTDAAVIRLLRVGRTDLPGPLCQIGLARDGTAYVVAAGRANHAGTGGWHGVTGNANALGIEAFNDGLGEPWPHIQLDAYDRTCAAVLRHVDRDASWLCGHREWAPGRKIDPTGIDMNMMRSRVQNQLESGGDMALRKGDSGNAVAALQKALNAWSPALGLTVDKIYGDATVKAVVVYQEAANLPPTGTADGVTLALLLTTSLRP